MKYDSDTNEFVDRFKDYPYFIQSDESEVLAKIYETPFEEVGISMEVAETLSRDISEELADLHDAKGANFVRLLKQIASHGEFRSMENEECIFSTGGERSEDFPNLLDAARKAVGLGYKVYILPNPNHFHQTWIGSKPCI